MARRLYLKSFLHIPLDLGSKVAHTQHEIDAAGAAPATLLILSEEKSLRDADLFIDVTKPVAGLEMAHLSGRFLTKVHDSRTRTWAAGPRR